MLASNYPRCDKCNLADCTCKPTTTSTLNGKWPSDTWFQRARARKLKQDAEELESWGPPPKDQL